MKKPLLYLLFLLTAQVGLAQQSFRSLEEVFVFADSANIDLVISNLRSQQARQNESTSRLGIVNPTISLPTTFTHYTNLPVTLLPAEIFGGEPGSNVELRTGVPYTTNLSQTLDLQLVNPGGWSAYRLAQINSDIAAANGELSRQKLQENLADVYYNIVNLNQQQASAEENLVIADSVLQITQNKFDAGLVGAQALNNTKVNQLNSAKSLKQIGYLLKDAHLTLKLLLNIPEDEELEVYDAASMSVMAEAPEARMNQLTLKTEMLNQAYSIQSLKQSRSVMYPSLSFFAGNTFQLNNQEFQPVTGDWINSNYVGLRLNITLPTSNSISQLQRAKFDLEIANQELEQARTTARVEAKRLENTYAEAWENLNLAESIQQLNIDTYEKNLNLYKEGLISVDDLLNSYEAMVNATYSVNSARISTQLALSKIIINNKFN